MPIRHFCKTCPHRKIPQSLKEKFNEHIKLMFIECPTSDECIAGCLIKNITVEWKSFVKWTEDNKLLTEDEKKSLKLMKLYEEKDA